MRAASGHTFNRPRRYRSQGATLTDLEFAFTSVGAPNEVFDRVVPAWRDGLERRGIMVEPTSGGRIRQGDDEAGTVERWTSGREIVLRWSGTTGGTPGGSWVKLRFVPDPAGTRVVGELHDWGRFLDPSRDVGPEWIGGALLPAIFDQLAPRALGDWITDQWARRPSGAWARATYRDPTYHWPNFLLILDRIRPTAEDRLLEVGCGGGALLARALESGCSATGVDHSPEMVRLAREVNRDAIANGRLEIRAGDAGALPVPDAQYTCCVSTGAIGFFPDPPRALAEMHRALRPGGRIAIFASTPELRGTPAAPEPIASRARFYTPPELRGLVEAAGFVEVHVEEPDLEPYARAAGLPEDVIAIFTGTGGALLALARKGA